MAAYNRSLKIVWTGWRYNARLSTLYSKDHQCNHVINRNAKLYKKNSQHLFNLPFWPKIIEILDLVYNYESRRKPSNKLASKRESNFSNLITIQAGRYTWLPSWAYRRSHKELESITYSIDALWESIRMR